MRYAVIVRARAPQPVQAPAVVTSPGVAAAGPNGCTGTAKSGQPCAGRGGEDGRCAVHKEKP